MNEQPQFMALKAIGKAGDWQIDLDELVKRDSRLQWGLTIAGKAVCLQILIEDESLIFTLLDLLKVRGGELRVGSWHGADAVILKEKGRLQFRFFYRENVNQSEFAELIELSLTGNDLEQFVKAVEDLVRDMKK